MSSASPTVTVTTWFDAVRSGNWSYIQTALESNFPIDTQDEDERTALMIACEEGLDEVVKGLIEKGGKVDVVDKSGQTPLMYACDSGHLSCIQLIFTAYSDNDDLYLNLNIADSQGDTVLHKAVRSGSLECIKYLLEYEDQKLDMEIMNDQGETALLAAIASNGTGSDNKECIPVLELLLTHPRNQSKINRANKLTGVSPLLLACQQQNWEVVKYLSSVKGIDINAVERETGNTALIMCVVEDASLDVIRHLLEKSQASQTVQNKKGYTAIHLAVRDENVEVVEVLVKGWEKSKNNAASSSSSSSSLSPPSSPPISLSTLLDSEFGWTVVQHAASKNSLTVLTALCRGGSLDLNAQDKRGSTALHLTSRLGHLASVKLLLQAGARADVKDATGNTPLMDAIAAGQVDVVKELLSSVGKKTSSGEIPVDTRGNTPLHKVMSRNASSSSSSSSTLDLLTHLLSHYPSSSIHTLNADGETVWTLATQQANKPVCDILLKQAKLISPPAPSFVSVSASGDASVLVEFEQHVNAKLIAAAGASKSGKEGEWKYTVRAVAVEDGVNTAAVATQKVNSNSEVEADEKEKSVKKAAAAKKSTPSKEAEEKKGAPSTTATATVSSAVKKAASAKKSSSTKKNVSSSSSTTSSLEPPPTSSTAASSSSKKKKSSSSSSSSPSSSSSSLTITGSSSPLRLTGLTNGVRYTLSISCTNSIGSSPEVTWPVPVLIGTPAAPSVVSVKGGESWIEVEFMPPLSSGSDSAGSGGSGTPAVTEFIMTACVASNNSGSGSSRNSSTSSTSSLLSKSSSSTTLSRSIMCYTSPALMTGLIPNTKYSVTLRAKNMIGEGVGTSERVVMTGTASGLSDLSSARSNLIPINPAYDAAELREASSLLTGCLSSDVLPRGGSNTTADSAAYKLHSAARIESSSLRSAYDRMPSTLQALGCSRADSEREEVAVVYVSSAEEAQLIATNSVLPASHPLSHAYSTVDTLSSSSTSYNHNLYPIGNPAKGCYLYSSITKRVVLAQSNAGQKRRSGVLVERKEEEEKESSTTTNGIDTNSASASSQQVYQAILCRVRPGRCRSEFSTVNDVTQSTQYDSHRKTNSATSTADIYLYSSSQILPLYFLTFSLPHLHSASRPTSAMTATQLSDARLASEVLLASTQPENFSAPLRPESASTYRSESANGKKKVSGGSATPSSSSSGYGMKKHLGGAPSSSIEPPGELTQEQKNERGAAAAVPSSSSSSRQARGEDLDDGEKPRLDINTAQSNLLGPKQQPSKTATVASAAAVRGAGSHKKK